MILDAAAATLEPAVAALCAGAPLSASSVCHLREPAEAHGLWLLLAQHAAADETCDSGTRQMLHQSLRDAAARDALQQAAHRHVIQALASAGIATIVLKGAHLGVALYEPSHLRPYSDLDLLVAPAVRGRARRTLVALGYQPGVLVERDAILAQMTFRRPVSGWGHVVDLHWHALSPLPFRHLLPFDEAWRRSRRIPELGEHARGLNLPDALLHAVAHLAAHHAAAPRLIWLADVDRLARRFGETEWMDFNAAVAAGGLAAVALDLINTATRFFATPVPESARHVLAAAALRSPLGTAFLEPRSKAGRLWLELRALRPWRDRLRLVVQHLVPDRRYMLERYGARGLGLVCAYVRRAASGARPWLRRPPT
jgi:hypothetical protein